mmetsp:Transcript_26695/g.48086  ORF Transcript_26695/g.48086 Transcript_26695/m.48086 type:complete len:287 (+) Transcript_26695:48-908(+)
MEDEPYMELEGPLPPEEPAIYIPLEKPQRPLTIQERIKLLQQEADEIKDELLTAKSSKSCLAELNDYVAQADRICKSQGVPDSELSASHQASRRITEALTNVLPTVDSVTYRLQTAIPEDYSSQAYISKVRDLSARVSAIEAVLGRWEPKYGYSTIEEAVSHLKPKVNAINLSKLESISKHLEELNAEFDLLQSQLDHLNTADDQLVEELYKSLSLCYEYRTVIPITLARLEAIKSVHEEGSWFNQRMQELTDKLDKVRKKLETVDLTQVYERWVAFKQQAKQALA